MIEQFLLAHRGPGATALGDGALERCVLHMFLCGRIDSATLRLERTLAHDKSDGIRLVLLALFSRLRSGHPRAASNELVDEIASALDSVPERPPREFDSAAHLAIVASCKSEIVRGMQEDLAALAASPRLHAPLIASSDVDPFPLVCHESGSFAFARLHASESDLVSRLASRLDVGSDLGEDRIQAALRSIDALPGHALHQAQRDAVEAALRGPFLVLTGGPGTGKTTVVSRILLALARCLDGFDPESVALCAPTGRAKSRMSESIGRNLAPIAGVDPVAAALSGTKASTLHSLLGALPDGSFRHGPDNPLPHRVVVLDEASMVDLPLFASFFSALSARARLVVVGDPDQLPSVDAGAVLADLVANPHLQRIRAHLTHTHRNSGDIAEICRMAVQGRLMGAWLAGRRVDIGACREIRSEIGKVAYLGSGRIDLQIPSWLEERFGDGLRDAARTGFADPVPLLDLAERSRILCAVHDGESGAQTLNRIGDRWLRDAFPTSWRGRFAPGQQLILTRNHPQRDLWNGDLAVAAVREETLVAVFHKPTGPVAVPIDQLDGLESAWAITVHKSQGSEFDEILFALPDRDTPVLTRQILYTALSRARRTVLVHGDPSLADRAVLRSADRPGRLRGIEFV